MKNAFVCGCKFGLLSLITFSVLSVLKSWIDSYFYDFVEDDSLQKTLFSFLEDIMMNTMPESANRVKNLFERSKVQA